MGELLERRAPAWDGSGAAARGSLKYGRSAHRQGGGQDKGMEGGLRFLSVAALVAVFAVLLAGLWNMMRGTNPNRSQQLMRWRVGLQFLAIVIAMLLVYLLRP